ncbi:MAG: hypothetical protein M0Z40_04730, partial [Actinomycetota bacterium]|nr:hypothetical protein [Actinomycetota bacterium]
MAAIGVLVVLAGALGWYESESHPFGRSGAPVLVDVHRGEPFGAIATALAKRQVIGTSFAFRLWSLV